MVGNARGDGLAVGLESNPTASEDIFPRVFMAIHFAPAKAWPEVSVAARS